MNVQNGNISSLAEEVGEEKLNRLINEKKIVPIPKDEPTKFAISRWGIKKRKRYVELLTEGHTQEMAFQAVEFNRGEVSEKDQMDHTKSSASK